VVLDEVRILEALRGTGVQGEALEEGSRLVDHWIGEVAELDARDETLAVEAGFYVEVAPLTFVVGTQDRIFRSHLTGKVTGAEWKTTKHETKFWNKEGWFESISNSHQLTTYAIGLAYGSFIPTPRNEFPPVVFYEPPEEMDILVRAVSKSYPPQIWRKREGDLVTVSKERMNALVSTYRNVGEAVRGMRGTARVPWAVTGIHCTNMFRKECFFLNQCRKGEVLTPPLSFDRLGQNFSPGSQKVIQYLKESGRVTEGNWRDVVVLSASTLGDWFQCSEKWRREEARLESEGEANFEQGIGSVFHAGVGSMYEQMMEER